MLMRAVSEQLRVEPQRVSKIKCPNSEHVPQINVAFTRPLDFGQWIERSNNINERLHLLIGREIDLVDEHHIREGDLFARLLIMQLCADMARVDDRDDGIKFSSQP